jgi:gluconate 5-dehydrogenase
MIENWFSLKGKIALVTGGYRGLGLTIAEALAFAGAKVYINGRSADGVANTVSELQDKGLNVEGAIFDITDENSVVESVRSIENENTCIDILVNNAGIQRRGLLVDMSLVDFETVIQTNLSAAFIVSKAVVPAMFIKGGGKIINICSLMSSLARKTTGNYAAAKGGLEMLTKAMTAEWAEQNIQINGIAPGYFATEMTRPLVEDESFNSWICGRTPSARWGKPEELQALAVFLASKGSSFVNGQVVVVDGGLSSVI